MRKMQRALFPIVFVPIVGLLLGCNPISWTSDKLDGPYHHLSFGNGDYLRIKERATNRMIEGWFQCMVFLQLGEDACGTFVLQASRDGIRDSLGGAAGAAWDSIYHHGWNDGEGGDFAQALEDLSSRNHECLTVHFGWNWIWSSPNWTTADAGLSECSLGSDPCPQGTLNCNFD